MNDDFKAQTSSKELRSEEQSGVLLNEALNALKGWGMFTGHKEGSGCF